MVRWAKVRFGENDAETKHTSNSLQSRQLDDVIVRNAAESPAEHRDDWWCVKAAGGNGGMDIWVMHAGNWRSVTGKLQEDDDYVIQVTSDSNSMNMKMNMNISLSFFVGVDG